MADLGRLQHAVAGVAARTARPDPRRPAAPSPCGSRSSGSAPCGSARSREPGRRAGMRMCDPMNRPPCRPGMMSRYCMPARPTPQRASSAIVATTSDGASGGTHHRRGGVDQLDAGAVGRDQHVDTVSDDQRIGAQQTQRATGERARPAAATGWSGRGRTASRPTVRRPGRSHRRGSPAACVKKLIVSSSGTPGSTTWAAWTVGASMEPGR